jgi:hypothetical protein
MQDCINRILCKGDVTLIESLALFAPNSGGSYKARAALTLLEANQTFPFLARLADATGKDRCSPNRLKRKASTLIIDDGLHSPNANISVLAFALNNLKPGVGSSWKI